MLLASLGEGWLAGAQQGTAKDGQVTTPGWWPNDKAKRKFYQQRAQLQNSDNVLLHPLIS